MFSTLRKRVLSSASGKAFRRGRRRIGPPKPKVQKIDHDGFMTCANGYGIYAVHRDYLDRPAIRRLLRGDVHEPRSVEFLRTHARHGDLVMAGVFVGDMLPAVSHALQPGGLVWGFEPTKLSHELATKTIELNGLQQVRLRRAALSREIGTVSMVSEDSSGNRLGGLSRVANASKSLPRGLQPGRLEEVPSVTIDSAVPEDRWVAVIQLDLEGHEPEALAGARQTLRRCRPWVMLEVGRETGTQAFQAVVPKLDYRMVGKLEHNTIWRSFRPVAKPRRR